MTTDTGNLVVVLKRGEPLTIGPWTLTVTDVHGPNWIKVRVEAPRDIDIQRERVTKGSPH